MSEPRLIDTNILVGYYTNDEPPKRDAAARLLARIELGQERGLLTHLVFLETVFTLQRTYRVSKAAICTLMLYILSLDGILFENKSVFVAALGLYRSTPPSFADAYHVTVMRRDGLDEVYSYDHDFDRFPDITRIEPA